MKFIRMKSSHNGERVYVAQEIRRTKKETQGQQAKADVHRKARIALYQKRYEEGRDLTTGSPISPEDRDEVAYVKTIIRKSNNERSD
jgi:hypothetical protein